MRVVEDDEWAEFKRVLTINDLKSFDYVEGSISCGRLAVDVSDIRWNQRG